MPLPSAACPADINGDVCCDTFWLIGERLRTVACEGVCACMDPDCADQEFISYQNEGPQASDALGESLAVNFIRAAVRIDSRRRNSTISPTFVTRVEYRLELLESGWPILSNPDGTIIPADRAALHALSKHARGHAEKMWRSIAGAAATTDQTKALFPSATNPHVASRGVTVGDLQPLPRPGPQVGYYMNVSVDTMLL